MGKRSTSTTKSGKFMNPTDQARKEARRRELKKNKKQRLLVRQAVLKGKDPTTIFSELEKIDQMEFNPVQSAPLSEKVLKEKRKKLRDTLNRIMRLYEKDDPGQWTQIKSMEVQYEKRRAELIIYCESVRHTQTVNLEEIPLPNLETSVTTGGNAPSSLPPPPSHGILKKISAFGGDLGKMFRKAPGVPSVPPPEIYDIWDEGDALNVKEPGIPGIDDEDESDLPPYHTYYQLIRPPTVSDIELPNEEVDEEDEAEEEDENEEDDDDDESDEDDENEDGPTKKAQKKDLTFELEREPPPKPTSLQARMLAMAGQDVDTYIKEREVVHRQREMNRQVNLENRLARLEKGIDDDPDYPMAPAGTGSMPPHGHHHQQQQHHHPMAPAFQRPPMMPPFAPMGQPPPAFSGGFVPPPLSGSRLPPGPPPRLPHGIPPTRMVRAPGMPPPPPPAGQRPMGGSSSVAPAALGGRGGSQGMAGSATATLAKNASGKAMAATIEAKPQMRNLSADLTRFVPTTLKLKKEVAQKRPHQVKPSTPHIDWKLPQAQSGILRAAASSAPGAPAAQSAPKTKDDAYSQFMKEMQGLI